jgi:NADH-quinone oxidoreductase subunit M
MNLLLILFIPLLTALGVLLVPRRQSKIVALAGAVAQLLLCLFFFIAFNRERSVGNVYPILFEQQYNWFPSLGFSFHIGIDGIALAMILLTAFVVIAGVLVSWKMDDMPKEFFFLLILLSIGAYGFFMQDLS